MPVHTMKLTTKSNLKINEHRWLNIWVNRERKKEKKRKNENNQNKPMNRKNFIT